MTGDDAARWQAAKQLRAEHPKWLVIWVARTQQFHACLLASSRAGASTLTDAEPAGLATQMQQADHAADVAAGCVAFLHADSPGALAGQLRAQEALRRRQLGVREDRARGIVARWHPRDPP